MKRHGRILGNILIALCILTIGVFGVIRFREFPSADEKDKTPYIRIAEEMNIRNLVSLVYLGPRAVDTAVEVLVVVLTVFGIQYLGKKE